MREALLSIADHYELDADLLESSLQTIIDSERLIAKADQLFANRMPAKPCVRWSRRPRNIRANGQ
jgi:hypothetical protein